MLALKIYHLIDHYHEYKFIKKVSSVDVVIRLRLLEAAQFWPCL